MSEVQKRKNLKLFRIGKDLSQQGMADVLGVTRSHYAMIERGERRGSESLWTTLKNTFDVSDADMWNLMRKGD